MKANRRYREADDGASVIVGAILLFALSFLVLVMIQSNFVPVWEQDAEAAHAQTIRSQMTLLKSQMERQIEEGVTTPISSAIDLNRDPASQIFGNRYVSPGILSLGLPGSATFNVTSPELNIATVTDPTAVGVGETWDLVDGDTLDEVSRIASLRVRFGTDAKPFVNEWAYLDVTDANGDFVGRLGINLLQMSTNGGGINQAEFWIQTEDAAGNQIGAQYFEANNQQVPPGSEPPYAWINALHPDYRFDRILGSAAKPLQLTLTTTGGMPADFSAAYYQHTVGGGEILVGGGTEIVTDYEDTMTGTRIVYDALPQYYVDQDLVLEYGALLVVQDGAGSITSPPALAVGSAANRTSLTWTLPNVVAGVDGITSSPRGLLVTTAFDHQILTATGPSVTIVLDTDHGDAWVNYFRNAFERAGGVEGTHYSVSSDSNSATLTVSGPVGGTTHDVALAIQSASVEVLL